MKLGLKKSEQDIMEHSFRSCQFRYLYFWVVEKYYEGMRLETKAEVMNEFDMFKKKQKKNK